MSHFLAPGLLEVVGLPFLVAPFAYLLRRFTLWVSSLSIATIVIILWWVWQIPDGTATEFLGRQLALDPLQRMGLLVILLSAAGVFLFAWRVSQGWSLFPLLLVSLGFFDGALLFRNPEIAVLLAELGMLTCIFLVQGGPTGNTQGAMHFLTTVVLAIPLFLVAVVLLHRYDMHSDVTALLQTATILLFLGFALVCALFPFHTWLPTLSETAPPTITAFIALSVPLVFFVILATWMVQFPALREEGTFSRLLLWGGLSTAILGGVLAFAQDHLGRWWAHLVLADLGYLLVGLGLATPLSLHGTMYGLINRSMALLLAGQSLAVIQHRATGLSRTALRGVAFRVPVSLLGISIGSLSLLGIPASSGFFARWLLYQALLESGHAVWVWILLASTAFAGLGYARIVRTMFNRSVQSTAIEQEPRLTSLILILLIFCVLLLSLYPQLAAGPVQAVLTTLPFGK